jgi:glutathione S-transferase
LSTSTDPTLYVIPGSHACRSAMLMLAHKGIAYRSVELRTGMHPYSLRLKGFPGNDRAIRTVDGETPGRLAMMNRAGTVPALRFGGERIQTNFEIARFLDRVSPDPPLFPNEPGLRAAVEQAERWADGDLQMTARRIALAGAGGGLDNYYGRGNAGRLGALLSGSERQRVLMSRMAGTIFRASSDSEGELLGSLPDMLDRVDALIADGVIAGVQLNVADFMIVPSLALMAYRLDLRADVEARPAGQLLERVLPEPAG